MLKVVILSCTMEGPQEDMESYTHTHSTTISLGDFLLKSMKLAIFKIMLPVRKGTSVLHSAFKCDREFFETHETHILLDSLVD